MSKVTTFGTSKRGSIVRPSSFVPAPNQYNTVQHRKVKGKAKMSSEKRANSVKDLTPGPGHYAPRPERRNGVTILEKHNFSAVLKEKLAWPGPQSYSQLPTRSTRSAIKGGTIREKTNGFTTRKFSAGPGTYQLKSCFDCPMPKVLNKGFSCA